MFQVVRGVAARGRRRSRAGVHAVRRCPPRDAVHPRPARGGGHRGGEDQHRQRHRRPGGLRRRERAALGDGPEHRRSRRRRRVHRNRRAWTPTTRVLDTYRINVFNGEVTDADRATETAQIAGTSLAVDQSGTFSVCTRLSAGSVAGTAYRTDFIVVERGRVTVDARRFAAACLGALLCGFAACAAHLRPQRAGRGCPLSHGHGGAAAGRGHPERGQPPGRLPGADPGDQARPEKRPVPPHARDAVPVQPGPPVGRAGDPARSEARPGLRRGAQQPRADLSLAGEAFRGRRGVPQGARRTSRTRRRNTPPTISARRPTC